MKKELKGGILILIVMLIIIICGFMACSNGVNGNQSKDRVSTIYLMPLDGISEKQLLQLKSDIEKNFADNEDMHFIVDTLGHRNSPKECLNKAKTRLWAKSMVNFLKANYLEIAEAKAKEMLNLTASNIKIVILSELPIGIFQQISRGKKILALWVFHSCPTGKQALFPLID